MKMITKITKNKNEKKNIVRKTIKTKIMTAEKEKTHHKDRERNRKKKKKIIFNVESFKRIKRIKKQFKNETIKLK